MTKARGFGLGLLLAFLMAPVAATAQPATSCDLSFSDRSLTITLLASDLGVGQSVAGRGDVLIEAIHPDDGRQDCVASVRLSYISATPRFPDYSMTASNQPIVPSANETIGGPRNQVRVAVPSNRTTTTIALDAVAATEWGLVAGRQTEQLQLTLVGRDGDILDRIPLFIDLEIPKAVDVMFVGATGSGPASSIDLGDLSASERVTSQPFGVRVWSSSGYEFTIQSENAGNLVHQQALDQIPYELLVNGFRYELRSAPAPITSADPSEIGGDRYGLTISVPARRSIAGEYQDRLMITVNAI